MTEIDIERVGKIAAGLAAIAGAGWALLRWGQKMTLAGVDQRIDTMERDNATLRARVEQLEKDVASREDIARLERQLGELRSDFVRITQAADESRARLHGRIDEILRVLLQGKNHVGND